MKNFGSTLGGLLLSGKRKIPPRLSIMLMFFSFFLLVTLTYDAPPAMACVSTAAIEGHRNQPSADSLLGQFLGNQSEVSRRVMHVFEALLSLALAALLAALLAFRPQKELSLFRRNPFIVQTQILLAVVGAALMIIVADSAARAFGIFASASLIRFRTNIRNPKEITVLLVSLAVGLASGVGRWELAIALTLFVILMLWPLERFELTQVIRAMELEIKTKNLVQTETVLKKIFKRHHISAELREAESPNKQDEPGTILHFLNLSPHLSTDKLSEEIFQADAENIESIKWEQKNSRSYIYS